VIGASVIGASVIPAHRVIGVIGDRPASVIGRHSVGPTAPQPLSAGGWTAAVADS